MRKTKIAAIVAAAAVLVLGMAFTSMAAAKGWVAEEDGWTWQDADGNRITNEFKADGNNWYYLDDDGVLLTDSLVEYNEKLYYVGADGARVTSKWVSVYDEDADEDFWYWFNTSGVAVTGKKTCPVDNGSTATATFLFDADKHMLTGWVSGNVTDGFVAQNAGDGTDYIAGQYFCDDNGQMVTSDWRELEIGSGIDAADVYFYFGSTGLKYDNNNIKKIDGKKYDFSADGEMTADAWVLASGATPNTAKYYDANGTVKTGWFQAIAIGSTDTDGDKYWYHADKTGALACNTFFKDTNGKTYFIDADCHMQTGLWKIHFTGDVTIDTATGANGTYKIEKTADKDPVTKWYATASTARDKTGYYYFGADDDADTDGALKTGEQTIALEDDSITLAFAASGYKGRALDGLNSKKFYTDGVKLAASADDVYQVVQVKTDAEKGNATYYEKVTAAAAQNGAATLYKMNSKKELELYGFGTSNKYYDSAKALHPLTGKTCYVFNTAGSQIFNTTKEDGNGYKLEVAKTTGELTGIYVVY